MNSTKSYTDQVMDSNLVRVMGLKDRQVRVVVRSGDSGKLYTVTKRGVNDWVCTCPDHVYRQRKCKHMKALWNLRADVVSYDARKVS